MSNTLRTVAASFPVSASTPALPLARLGMKAAVLAMAMAAMPAWSLDLRQAYEAAYANDAGIRASRAGADASRERLPQAQAQRRPNISFSAGRNYNDLTSKTQDFRGQPVRAENSYYSGNQNLLVRQGCLDFMSGKPFDLMTTYTEPIDVHHIFPEKWCKAKEIEPRIYNSILNKTPLSAESNRSIGGDAPSRYLLRIEKQHAGNKAAMDAILRSHLIDPGLLRADDFHGFMAARKNALAHSIGDAMGRPVVFNPMASAASPDALGDDVPSLDEPVEA